MSRWTEAQLQAHLEKGREGTKRAIPVPMVKETEKQAVRGKKQGKESIYALGRLKQGKMNKTEAKYAELLEGRKQAGEILWYSFEGINLRLADCKCFYMPDFFVMLASGQLEAHEVKGGFWEQDAMVKIKVAVTLYPFKFIAMQYKNKTWVQREF